MNFRTKSSLSIFESLAKSSLRLRELSPALNDAQLSILKEGIVASLQELNCRLQRIGESCSDLSSRVSILQGRISFYISTKLSEFISSLPLLDTIIHESLSVFESFSSQQIVDESLAHLIQAFEILEKSFSVKNMFLNIKLFGVHLLKFLELCALQYHQLESSSSRREIFVKTERIKKTLPSLISSLNESFHGSHPRSKIFFFSLLRESLIDLSSIFSSEPHIGKPIEDGFFLKTMNEILEDSIPLFELDKKVEWIVKFGLSVASSSEFENDKTEILKGSQMVLMELKDQIYLHNALRDLEQRIHHSLLKSTLHKFSILHEPLRHLLSEIENSSKELSERRPDDLESLISSLDDHNDALFHIAYHIGFCSNNSDINNSLASSIDFLSELEKEIIPAVLRLYLTQNESGARFHMILLRDLWNREMSHLEKCLLKLIDPGAFVQLANTEIKSISSTLKKRENFIDITHLRSTAEKIIKITQLSLHLTSLQELSQETPVFKLELSLKEISVVIKSLLEEDRENESKINSFIRRIQFLVTSHDIMANYMEKKNSPSFSSSVTVLTSVSRISVNSSERSASYPSFQTTLYDWLNTSSTSLPIQTRKMKNSSKSKNSLNILSNRLIYHLSLATDNLERENLKKTMSLRSKAMKNNYQRKSLLPSESHFEKHTQENKTLQSTQKSKSFKTFTIE